MKQKGIKILPCAFQAHALHRAHGPKQKLLEWRTLKGCCLKASTFRSGRFRKPPCASSRELCLCSSDDLAGVLLAVLLALVMIPAASTCDRCDTTGAWSHSAAAALRAICDSALIPVQNIAHEDKVDFTDVISSEDGCLATC